ncbi:MAG: PspC domain-containing protein, partial [Lachnospiraceae bacterium]|nr:PspC domain-containing protein [Lachnospiraceae bacterium]
GGGIGEYLDVDPTLVRLIILLIILSGTGILLYLGAALIIPMEPYENE